ncbi:hypothetical protein ACFLTH_04860 [Bacteroidota bacterium]
MILLDINNFEFEIKKHAFDQALKRKIDPDYIESTLKGGRIKRFSKHNLKFIKKFNKFTVICVGEIKGTRIKILTIYKK